MYQFESSLSDPTDITELGKLLSKLPIDPKFGKMIIVATKYNLTHFAIMMVACLSVQEIYDDSKLRNESQLEDLSGEDQEESDSDLETQIDRDRKAA